MTNSSSHALRRLSRLRPATLAARAAAALVVAAFAIAPLPSVAVEAGDTAPVWTAEDTSGRQVEFPGVLEGKPAVMVFWATWCPYCKAFMPYLEPILDDYSDQGVQVIAVNTREGESDGDPMAYIEDLGFPLVGILEGDEIAADYAVHFIPGLMVVDGTGTVSWRRESTDLPPGDVLAEFWSAEVRTALDAALASASGSLPAP